VSYLHAQVKCGEAPSFKDFERDVACLTYGDDVVIAADDKTLQQFNRVGIREVASKLGMNVTAANKGDELLPYEKLESLSFFLKSTFKVDGRLVMAPMPIDVAVRELQFIDKRNKNDARIQRDIFGNALRFAAHDGRKRAEKLKSQLSELGYVVPFDYEDFILEMYEKQAI